MGTLPCRQEARTTRLHQPSRPAPMRSFTGLPADRPPFSPRNRGPAHSTHLLEPVPSQRFAGPVDPENPVGSGCYFRTMRDIDPRQRKLLQIAVDLRFLVEVQVSRAFIEEKNLRLAVQGARQQQTLLLSAGQRAAHITDQAVVGHRHRHDLVVDASHSGAFDHPFLIARSAHRSRYCRRSNRTGAGLPA